MERTIKAAFLAAVLTGPLALTACNSSREVFSHGYQLNEETLGLIPEGSSRDQVLISLGTPSSTQKQPNGSETFYYISQTKARPVAFMAPKVIDQRVLAIYLDENEQVERIANYGLKDGKVFDFVARVTPTGGQELTFLGQILRAGSSLNPAGLLSGG